MAITPWIGSVKKVNNGEDVSAEVVNPILIQHTQREQHLYERLQEIEDKSVLIAFNQPILPSAAAYVQAPTVVYFEQEGTGESATYGIAPAVVDFTTTSAYSSAYTPSNSSYAIGLVKTVSGDSADVYIWGLVTLDYDLDDATYGIIQSDEADPDSEFLPGPFYLSRTEAGKITRNPGGIAIYLGYAFDRRTFLLAPNVSEFNQFFTTYRFNLLDRPSGTPSLSGTDWTITGVTEVSGDGGVNHVGWIPVDDLVGGPLESFIPDGATFFYNLPSEAEILADSGMDSDSVMRLEQAELMKTLPPNPTSVTLLTVNGIIQSSISNDPDGVYLVNTAGIWWFSDQDGQQPWASDIPDSVVVTFDNTTNEMTVPDGAFEVDDAFRIKLDGGAVIPTGLAEDTTYYVKTATPSGSDQIITFSTTKGGAEVAFTTDGSGTIRIPQVYIWKFAKGTDEYRPRMLLQFLKFNPALRDSIVTSIKKFNNASDALTFYGPSKATEASTGDLYARLKLNFEDGTDATSSATAISNVIYDEETGVIEVTNTPVVSKLTAGSGILITQVSTDGVEEPGSYLVSSTSGQQAGRVSNIEPDGAELLYEGLHSYLNMQPYSTLPSSLIGKILLPANVPDADMSLILFLIGGSSLSLGGSAKNVAYDFSYSISKPGSVLSAATTPATLTFAIPNSTAAYTAKTCFKVGGVTASTYSIPLSGLKIPATAFKGGDCAVNFKLARVNPSSGAYTGDIGVVDIYWKIG